MKRKQDAPASSDQAALEHQLETLRQDIRRLAPGFHPKVLIHELAEGLLAHYEHQPTAQALIDPYAVYQHLTDYWADTMQDDAYLIAEDG